MNSENSDSERCELRTHNLKQLTRELLSYGVLGQAINKLARRRADNCKKDPTSSQTSRLPRDFNTFDQTFSLISENKIAKMSDDKNCNRAEERALYFDGEDSIKWEPGSLR